MEILLRLDVSELSRAVRRVERGAMEALDDAVERASELVAFTARADHPYTDRTGDLTKYTEALPTRRLRDQGAVEGGVIAGTPYASFVNRNPRFAFLEPALAQNEARIDQELDQILDAAMRDLGL